MDYDRAKFQVKDAAEFEKIWQEYVRAKEYERKFQENTKQLQLVQDQLLELLRDNHVATPDIWLSQTLAIIDPQRNGGGASCLKYTPPKTTGTHGRK